MIMKELLKKIRTCDACKQHLELGPRPVLTAHPASRIVIVGQAPGRVVHHSGIPWDDKSGDNLRTWLEMEKADFYDPKKTALIPMGFCFPGSGKGGDLPPRPECAPMWHKLLLGQMKEVRLILLVGKYAQDHYLGSDARPTLTETVRNYMDYLPRYFVLPHPSPRNNIWQKKNPWFREELLEVLKSKVKEAMI